MDFILEFHFLSLFLEINFPIVFKEFFQKKKEMINLNLNHSIGCVCVSLIKFKKSYKFFLNFLVNNQWLLVIILVLILVILNI